MLGEDSMYGIESMLGSLFSLPVLIGAVVLVLIVAGRKGAKVVGPTLVLRKFKVNEKAVDGVVVEIKGRAPGFMGWLLTAIGFSAETELKVSKEYVSFSSSNLFGQVNQVIPLPSVSSTHCGYSKPLAYLVLGILFVLGGIILFLTTGNQYQGRPIEVILIILVALVIGGVLLRAFYLSKRIVVSFETSGGMILGLSFSRSVMETVSVDIQQALEAVRVINENVIASQM